MKEPISRRDFLKLTGLLPLSLATPSLEDSLTTVKQSGKAKNVIILVFDALSASNVSLYGYQRETTPNITRLAKQAVVYHNHYSGGNFTTPGTASLFTGTYPWTHRAFGFGKSRTKESFTEKNIFSAFKNYYRIAYSHNPVANRLLTQFSGNIDQHVPLEKLFLTNDDLIHTLFGADEDTASVSWVRTMKRKDEGFAYSLLLAQLYSRIRDRKVTKLYSQFPNGLPHIASDNYFLLEDAIDWLGNTARNLPQPFIGYFHFMPPHRPYHTHIDFHGHLNKDGYLPINKPQDVFAQKQGYSDKFLLKRRTNYDEFILYVDREFGRFVDMLASIGLLENTWIILTSDHGELFERGFLGHITPVLYEPIIKIPLIIFEPGRRQKKDVFSTTSAVDVLPTLLHLTGQKSADWSEGIVLPPFSEAVSMQERNIFVVQAKNNAQDKPLTNATVAMLMGNFKFTYFFGYDELGENHDRIELYDITDDPEELTNLYSTKKETSKEMFDALKIKIAEVNMPYD